MLSQMVRDHQRKTATRRDIQERQAREASLAASTFTRAIADHLNVGVSAAYSNQRKLDAEAKQLAANTQHFAKHTTHWLKLVSEFNSAIKELGDVTNWARAIEADMQTVSSALEIAYKGQSGR